MKTFLKMSALCFAAFAANNAIAQNGWQAEYFNWGHYSDSINAPREVFNERPTLSRWEFRIVNNWEDGSPDNWQSIGSDYFAARYSSRQHFNVGGLYTFSATADDGVRIYVNGSQITDEYEWRVWSVRTVQSSIYLNAGFHDIRVEYFEREGKAQVDFNWFVENSTPIIVPPPPPPVPSHVGIRFDCLPKWTEQSPYYLKIYRIESNGVQTQIPQIRPDGSSNPNGVWANNGGVLTVQPLVPFHYYRVIFGRGGDHLQEQTLYASGTLTVSDFGRFLIQHHEKANLPNCF